MNTEGKADELDNMAEVAALLKTKFEKAGFVCELQKTHDGALDVLTGVLGAGRPKAPVIFTGHYDTVFRRGTFSDNPFRIKDGRAYGPGCLDMKGGLVIALYTAMALEVAVFKERPVKIAFAGDEEGGKWHSFATKVMADYARGCAAAFNMETGPIGGKVCTGRMGAVAGHLTVHGVTTHSGNNFKAGRNAVVDAAEKIVEIDRLTDVAKGTLMTVAIVNGGQVINQIPGQCDVDFLCRFSSYAEKERVTRALSDIFAKPYIDGTTEEYQWADVVDIFEEKQQNLSFWKFVSGQAETLGMKVGHVFLGGGSDAYCLSNVSVPTLCACGVRGEWNHTEREYAVVDSMYEYAKLWCTVISHLNELSVSSYKK